MKLSYFDEVPNFGDALNPVLARRIFGDIFNQAHRDRFLFIGTTIGRRAPEGCREIIVGAGAGYQMGRHSLDRRKVFCVRGPTTCDILGIDRECGAIDPAILASRFFKAERNPTLFMPHHQTHTSAGRALREICGHVGLRYVSPFDPAEKIIKRIGGARRLITEALHGAVVAESFNVPWVPIIFGSKVLVAKWRDFCASVGVDYRPVEIFTNIAFDRHPRFSHRIKYAAYRLGMGKAKYKYLPVRRFRKSALLPLEGKLRELSVRDAFLARPNAQVKAASIGRLEKAIDRFGNHVGGLPN